MAKPDRFDGWSTVCDGWAPLRHRSTIAMEEVGDQD